MTAAFSTAGMWSLELIRFRRLNSEPVESFSDPQIIRDRPCLYQQIWSFWLSDMGRQVISPNSVTGTAQGLQVNIHSGNRCVKTRCDVLDFVRTVRSFPFHHRLRPQVKKRKVNRKVFKVSLDFS